MSWEKSQSRTTTKSMLHATPEGILVQSWAATCICLAPHLSVKELSQLKLVKIYPQCLLISFRVQHFIIKLILFYTYLYDHGQDLVWKASGPWKYIFVKCSHSMEFLFRWVSVNLCCCDWLSNLHQFRCLLYMANLTLGMS